MENKLDRVLDTIANHQLRTLVYVLAFMIIGFVLPWWSILFVAAFIGWIEQGLLRACVAALITCFLAWFLLTLAFDIMNGFRISTRLGGLVGVPFPVIANFVSAALGGIVAALAAGTSNQLEILLKLARASR